MKTVFTNGCFDVLHPGHLRMLDYCASLGYHLTVGIDTDKRVKELKGPTRPIYNQDDRVYMLNSLKTVDRVVLFGSEEELTSIVRSIKPDFMVVGSDYIGKRVVGSEYAEKLLFFERIDEYSTTKTIKSASIG